MKGKILGKQQKYKIKLNKYYSRVFVPIRVDPNGIRLGSHPKVSDLNLGYRKNSSLQSIE